MSLLLALMLAVSAAAQEYELPAPPPEPHVEFSADHLDYEKDASMVHLKGAVLLKESTWTIKADELWLNTQDRRARSKGYLLVEDGRSALYGDSGEFDLGRHEGVLYNASAGHGDWRVHAKSLSLESSKKLEYRSADFTSCSYDPKPHYHFHASRVSVIPKDRLLATNVFFFLGRVPVFYLPFLYKSLAPTHFVRWRVSPGYDRRNGAFVRGTLTTDHGPYLRSKLFLDYYTAQGLGAGGELHRKKGEDSRGAVSAYRIRQTHDGRERWSVLGDQYQSVTSSVSLQARLQVQSDADFNNDYARSSRFRVTPELVNSGAVTYRLPEWTARVSYSRLDAADASRKRFLKQNESAPRLDVQSAPLRFGRLPWLNSLAGFADDSFDLGRGYQQRSTGASWEGTRTFHIARGISFAPKLGYGQTYSDRVDALDGFGGSRTISDAWIGRYKTEGTLRFGTLVGDVDVSHRFSRRQRSRTVADDAGASDHGIESNLLTVADAFNPTPRSLARLFSGYDFRTFRDHSVGFRRRVQPIVADVSYTPRRELSLALREDYQLEDGNRSFLFSGAWGDELGTFLGLGAGHNKATPDQYYLNADFGWSNATGTLRLGGALRSVVSASRGPGSAHGLRLFEKELSVAKQWHDFFTRLTGRLRPGGVKEVAIRIDMKLASTKEPVEKKDWEAEWFPERRRPEVERP